MHPNPRATREPEKAVGRGESQVLGRRVRWSDMKWPGNAGEFFFSETVIEHVLAGKVKSSEPEVQELSLHLMISP
jgi:hypothetical protein